MKCLRPQIRSNAEQFEVGVADLAHETSILAALDHPNIVKLYGRAAGDISNASKLDERYFILLDRLEDTLDDCIEGWKKTSSGGKQPPSIAQVKVACSIADALAYIHMNNIVYRDLKPANVGFDSCGVLKLFDFGFAIGINPPPPFLENNNSKDGNTMTSEEAESSDHLLYDKAGTPRYMAPEVALQTGYGMEVDVYSFGILLWEICNLKIPFAKIKSADDLHKTVFVKGSRPKVGKHLPENLKRLMESCWSIDPRKRPSMTYVKSMLCASVRDISGKGSDAVSDTATKRKKLSRSLTCGL